MDAFDRIEPVSRPLMAQVDTALATLGAPPAHQIWQLLREVAATPAQAVRFLAGLDPARLSHPGAQLREYARDYSLVRLPATPSWRGAAGESFALQLDAMRHHLQVDLAERLATTAAYVDAVADWQLRSRHRVARALAEVISSADAVVVRAAGAFGLPGSVDPAAHPAASAHPARGVIAAANIGAHVLASVAAALAEGRDLQPRWTGPLAPLPWSPPAAFAVGTAPPSGGFAVLEG